MGAFDGSIGAFVVGAVLACFLTGITSAQVFQYYQNFPNDRKLYKYLVFGLFIFDFAHTAISTWTIWDWCVTNFGNVEHLVVSPWSFGVDPMMVGIMSFVCQSFYAYRVWIVGKRKLLVPVIVLAMALVSLGFAIGATITIFTVKLFSRFTEYTYGVAAWLALGAMCDIIITCGLVYYLSKSKTGLLHTNSMLNRLIELIVSTNGLTASVAVLDAILFGASTTSWHVAANLALPKLYFNSLLVSLNARIELERRLIQSTSNQNEAHSLADLTHIGGSKITRPDVRTALGFGVEDCSPEIVYSARTTRNHTKSIGGEGINGIHVTTHQTVIADGGIHSTTYLPSSDNSEKDFYSSEKDEEMNRTTSPLPIARSAHFSPEIEHAQRFPGGM